MLPPQHPAGSLFPVLVLEVAAFVTGRGQVVVTGRGDQASQSEPKADSHLDRAVDTRERPLGLEASCRPLRRLQFKSQRQGTRASAEPRASRLFKRASPISSCVRWSFRWHLHATSRRTATCQCPRVSARPRSTTPTTHTARAATGDSNSKQHMGRWHSSSQPGERGRPHRERMLNPVDLDLIPPVSQRHLHSGAQAVVL